MRSCVAPIKVKDLEPLRRDIRYLKEAAQGSGATEVFMSAVSPGLIAAGHQNNYYPSRGEYLAAIADGQENVIAGTDCGFGTAVGLEMVDRNVTWAKFDAMAEGARIATQQLASVGA